MNNTELLIKQKADILGDIFDNLNLQVCSHCKNAGFGRKNSKSGCCWLCALNFGYFENGMKHDEINAPDSLFLEYKFDNKLGFFDNIKMKCKLPREKRSKICLEYFCHDMGYVLLQKYGGQIGDFIRNLVKEIITLREYE